MGTEIIEGSKIIAEFMEFDPTDKGFQIIDINSEFMNYVQGDWEDVQYHSSWDWLMPACYKWDTFFEGVNVNKKLYSVYEGLSDKLDAAVTLYEINDVFEQLVKNIKWLNKKWYQNQILNNTINHAGTSF